MIPHGILTYRNARTDITVDNRAYINMPFLATMTRIMISSILAQFTMDILLKVDKNIPSTTTNLYSLLNTR